jgi:hypothetical protein
MSKVSEQSGSITSIPQRGQQRAMPAAHRPDCRAVARCLSPMYMPLVWIHFAWSSPMKCASEGLTLLTEHACKCTYRREFQQLQVFIPPQK